jgi:hypothetical protein
MQLDYPQDFPTGFPGMPADSGNLDVASKLAIERLDFGAAVVKATKSGYTQSVRTPKRGNASTLVAAGDLITANVVNGNVNGVPISPITFATDHVTTMTALLAEIVAVLLAQGIVATGALSGSNRTITMTVTDGDAIFSGFVVTAGSTQTTFTATVATTDVIGDFRGATHADQLAPRADNTVGFEVNDSVGVVKKGRLWCKISSDVADGASVYLDMGAAKAGFFTDEASGNLGPVVGAKFIGAHLAATGYGVIDFNLP